MTDPNLTEQLETEKAETAAVLEADDPGKTQEDDMTEKITQEQRARLRELAGKFVMPLELIPDEDDGRFLSVLDDRRETQISLVYRNEYDTADFLVAAANLSIPLLDEVERLEKLILANWFFYRPHSDYYVCVHCSDMAEQVADIKHADDCIIKAMKGVLK